MKDLEKNNKLIAEFMGGRRVFEGDPESGGGWTWRGLKKNTPDLNYHKSWDWLMPVVGKIYNIIEKNNITRNNVTPNAWLNWYVMWRRKLSIFTPKKEVYTFCIEFIKWYNNE